MAAAETASATLPEPLQHLSPLPTGPVADYLERVNELMDGSDSELEEEIVRSVVSTQPIRLTIDPGEPLEQLCIPPDATAAQVACDLSFRPIEDAFRLAWKWLAWDRVHPRRMGFRDDVYPHANLLLGYPRADDGPKNLLFHLVTLRDSTYREIESTLKRLVADLDERLGKGTAAQGGVSRKPMKSFYHAPDPTSPESEARVLLTFQGASASELEAFVVPYGRTPHGGRTSDANITMEARSDRAQLCEQVEHWRLNDEWVRVRVLERDDEARCDINYWQTIADNPIAGGLAVPAFGAAYTQFRLRNPFPRFDKDEQLRNDNVARSSVLVSPHSPFMVLRDAYPDALTPLLRDTVLVDFMDSLRYVASRPASELKLPETLHWVPDAEPSTPWERSMAVDMSLDPSKTLFAEVDSWTTKTCQQLDRRNAHKQGEKARVLHEARRVRISRARLCLTYGRPSSMPQPEQYGWNTARAVCQNRCWYTGQAFGVNSANNYYVLATIFYRVNHGLDEMYKAQAIVDAYDRAQRAAENSHEDRFAFEAKMAEASAEANDDSPPASLELLDPDRTNPGAVLLAQYHWRLNRTVERINELRSKAPPKVPEMEAALDRKHAWMRFVYSHIRLVRAMLDGERCDDAFVTDQDLANGRLSRLTLNYPHPDLAPGEEQLRNLHEVLRIVDAIYTVQNGGSAANTATTAAAAQVTTRAGADEVAIVDEEEICNSGVVPMAVLTAVDTSTLGEGQEVPKKRRGRPPKSAVQKPPPGSAARKPNGGPRKKKAAAKSKKGGDAPVPLPLDTELVDEFRGLGIGAAAAAAVTDDESDDDVDRLADGVDRLAVLQETLDKNEEEDPELFDAYTFIKSIEVSTRIQEQEEAARERIQANSNAAVGKHGAMGIAVGSTERAQLGTAGQAGARPSTHTNPWVTCFRKIQLRPCVHREWSSRCDQISLAHPECYDFVVQALTASMLGLYRTCRNPAPFGLAIKMTRATDLALRYDACRHVMLAILFAHNELVIASLREAFVWQMEHDPLLWMLEGDWIRSSTGVARAVFHSQGQIGTVEGLMSQGYGSPSMYAGTEAIPSTLAIATSEPVSKGDPTPVSSTVWVTDGSKSGGDPQQPPTPSSEPPSTPVMQRIDGGPIPGNAQHQRVPVILPSVPHRPSIFRASHPNFVPYITLLFQFVSNEAPLVSAANRLAEYNRHMDSLATPEQQADYAANGVKYGPSVFRLSEATVRLILSEVEYLRPGCDIPFHSLRRIGVSETGCMSLRMACKQFMARVHDQTVRTTISAMEAMDFELCAVFFRFLNRHMQRTIIPLDPSFTRRQAIALRKKWLIPDDEPIPMHVLAFSVCSLAACREVRNMLVPQTQSTRSYGQFWAANDGYIGGMVCLSKKCIGVAHRNTVPPPELRTPWYSELVRNEPGETLQQKFDRLANIFYGQFQALGEEPVYEYDDARQRNYPSQAGEIATRIVIFAEAVKKATGGAARAEPKDLMSEEVLKEKLKQFGTVDPKAAEAAMASFSSLRDMCTREARQRDEGQYTLPCYRALLTYQPALGYVCALEGKKLAPFTPCTVCPGCGALTPYTMSSSTATGPNGPTCGCCDWIERQRAITPRCIICCQRGLGLTTTSKGHKGLRFAKETLQVRMLDDCTGGALEWRVGFVCRPCYDQCAQWIAMDHRDYQSATSMLRPVPLYASHILAGHANKFFTGGRDCVRQCEDISVPSKRALKTRVVDGVTKPAFPPPRLNTALKKWVAGVTRAQTRAKNKRDKQLARLAKKAGSAAVNAE